MTDAMLKRLMLVVFVATLSAALNAQRAPVQKPPVPPAAPPRPTAAPPPIVLPLPPLMTPPAGGLTTPFPFSPPDLTSPPRDLYRLPPGQQFRSRPHVPVVGAYGGYVGPYVGVGDSPAPSTSVPAAAPAYGMLRFDVTPTSAHVFVDSYYVGTIGDIEAQRVLMLGAGPHRIEIRAQEYETAAFDVRIEPHETVTYRAALERTRPAPPPRPARADGSTRLYVIPNCYLGNIPPRADRLPRGCDIKHVHVVGGP